LQYVENYLNSTQIIGIIYLGEGVILITLTYEEQYKSRELYDRVTEMMATVEELTATTTNVTEYQTQLNKEIQNVNTVSGKIEQLSGTINECLHTRHYKTAVRSHEKYC